jgi:hypothetical protein
LSGYGPGGVPPCGANHPRSGKPTEESLMSTRTIAIAALVIAVVLLIIFLA